MTMTLTEYQHDGHPDVAAQYSQGTFTVGTTDEPLGDVLDQLERRLREEGREYAEQYAGTRNEPDIEVSVNVEGSTWGEVTLRVNTWCDADEHDSDDCTCSEYVHALGIREE